MTKAGPSFAPTRDPGEFPVFLRDGKTLALARGGQLVVRSWHEENGQFQIGPERVVAPLAFGSGWSYGAPYDVAEGGRFLAIVRTTEMPPPRIRVVLNWDREVSRLADRDRRRSATRRGPRQDWNLARTEPLAIVRACLPPTFATSCGRSRAARRLRFLPLPRCRSVWPASSGSWPSPTWSCSGHSPTRGPTVSMH